MQDRSNRAFESADGELAPLVGNARYLADISIAGMHHAVMLRSPHAHARIINICTVAAERMPGVSGIFLASHIADLQPIPCLIKLNSADGTPRADAPWSILAGDRVRYEGEGVAWIVAETAEQAVAAAARIDVTYEVLPCAVDLASATCNAPLVWDQTPGNVVFDWEFGDRAKSDAIFACAHRTVTLEIINNRVSPTPMETRGAIGMYSREDDAFTLIAGTQGVHLVRRILADSVLQIPRDRLRVQSPRTGGGFGTKIFTYPEYALALWSSRRLGIPVRWIATRSEGFRSDTQARDNISTGALALDDQGNILAIRVDALANVGAYLSQYAPFVPTECGSPVLSGVYRIGHIFNRVRGVFTHTVPVDAYRGAGRPEANYILERLIDKAAREMGMDRAELRRRNLIPRVDKPTTTASGLSLDSGDFSANMSRALQHIDYARFDARRVDSSARGLLRGLGIANYLEANGGLAAARQIEPGKRPVESARARFASDGHVFLHTGTQSTGQRHSAVAKPFAEKLGLDLESILFAEGDTSAVAEGGGTGGSKSTLTSSLAILALGDKVIDIARRKIAELWGCSSGDIIYEDGMFRLSERNLTMTIPEIATQFAGILDCEARIEVTAGTFGSGCHICEVEIDPETGAVQIMRYVAADDFGVLLDAAEVEAQVIGGVAQGIGQALLEHVMYDAVSGRQLAGSFMEYALPTSAHIPLLEWLHAGTVCATNPLGIKGCAEAGASAAPPAVMNAIADALSDLVPCDMVQMPALPGRVWSWIHAVRS